MSKQRRVGITLTGKMLNALERIRSSTDQRTGYKPRNAEIISEALEVLEKLQTPGAAIFDTEMLLQQLKTKTRAATIANVGRLLTDLGIEHAIEVQEDGWSLKAGSDRFHFQGDPIEIGRELERIKSNYPTVNVTPEMNA